MAQRDGQRRETEMEARTLNRTYAQVFLAAGVLTAGIPASAAGEAPLPATMVWTSDDGGASGYAEASGVANALMKNNQVRIRIVPSGTSIGRLLPLVTGKANFGFLSNEEIGRGSCRERVCH